MCQKAIEFCPSLQLAKSSKDVLIQGPVYTQENVDDPALQAQLWAK